MFQYKYFKQAIVFILFCKILLLFAIPLTGDEAYFIKWGDNLDIGYYDHPPMIGWVIYALSLIYDSYIFFRFFNLVAVLIAFFAIYKIIRLYKNKNDALYIVVLLLISPIDVLLILLTNDTALLLFGTIGAGFFLYSFEKKAPLSLIYIVLGAIFLGLAFLSKYLAVFLIFSLITFSLYVYRYKALKNILIFLLMGSLFVVQNLYFNYNSCWNNIMFNFFARTESSSFSLKYLFIYFFMIIYLLTPWGIYFLYKSKENFKQIDRLLILNYFILGLIFIVFFIVALKNKVGLHWFLLYIPFMYILFINIEQKYKMKLYTLNLIFTIVHIIALVVILMLPLNVFKTNDKYSDVVFFKHTVDICTKIEQIPEDILFTTGYTSASVLSYHCKKNIKMLFNNSKYGRYDDKLLDVRMLDGKSIYIFQDEDTINKDIQALCGRLNFKKFEVHKANFYLLECSNFNYEQYKKNYLDIQKEKFYNIPTWLPKGDCYFEDRYYSK